MSPFHGMHIEHLGCVRSVVCVEASQALKVTLRGRQIEVSIADALRADVAQLVLRWQEREAKRYLTERVRARFQTKRASLFDGCRFANNARGGAVAITEVM